MYNAQLHHYFPTVRMVQLGWQAVPNLTRAELKYVSTTHGELCAMTTGMYQREI